MRLVAGTAGNDVLIGTNGQDCILGYGGDDVLTPVIPDDGFAIDERRPLTRDVLVDWFRQRAAPLSPDDFRSSDTPRWSLPENFSETCRL